MQVQQFVADTLQQIVRGVAAAQGEVRAFGAYVNGEQFMPSGSAGQQWVDFDLAVTVQRASGADHVEVVGSPIVAREGDSHDTSSTVTRVRFRVHVHFPNGQRAQKSG